MSLPISGPRPFPKPFIFAKHYQYALNWCFTNRIHPTLLSPVDSFMHKLHGCCGDLYILAGPDPFGNLRIDEDEVLALLEMYKMRPAKEVDLLPLRQLSRGMFR